MRSHYDQHFRKNDRLLHAVIRQVGPYRLRPSRDRFGMLVRSIISQQISIAAARSIRGRLETLVGAGGIQPQALLALSPAQLRSAGLSTQKASYLRDLAQKVHEGAVPLKKIGRLSDEQVIEELTQVKGIGRWTAQMFLIFALGREDVFPVDDFGVRMAISRLYGLEGKPGKQACLEVGAKWSPFASIGTWYCWRYLELLKQQKSAGTEYPV